MILTRKVGQKVYLRVGDRNVVLKVIDAKGMIVRLGLEADMNVKVEYALKDHLEGTDVDDAPKRDG